MFCPLLATLFALTFQQPSPPTPNSPIGETATASLFATDERLSRKVTLSATTMTLNDALKQIAAQSGVPVKMRDSKILGVQSICIFASEVPARQLLESIAALLRYRNISSEWQTDASGKGYALSIGRQYYAQRAARPSAADDEQKVRVVLAEPLSDTATPVVPKTDKEFFLGPLLPLEKANLKNTVADDWFTRYDTRQSTVEETTLPPAENASTMLRLFSEIARTQKVPILALLPESLEPGDEQHADITLPPAPSANGRTVASVLDNLARSPYRFRYKWHKGALLLRDPTARFPATP